MPTYKIVMIRHVESEWNKQTKLGGWEEKIVDIACTNRYKHISIDWR